MMPRKHLPSIEANYSLIHSIFLDHGKENKLDVDVNKIPFDNDIVIYNKTKVIKIREVICIILMSFYADSGQYWRLC